MTMKYDLVAFDFDGTLADTIPWFESVMDGVAEKYHFRKVDERDKEFLRQCDSREILRYLGVPIWKMPQIASHIRTLMQEVVPNVGLFDGIGTALHQMSAAGAKLAVVSSNSLQNVRRVLGHDIAGLIDYYECGASIFGKPAKLRRLLKLTGVDCRRTILIGDELRDIDAARAANICAGAVAWGYNAVPALLARQPDEVFLNVPEIPLKLIRADLTRCMV